MHGVHHLHRKHLVRDATKHMTLNMLIIGTRTHLYIDYTYLTLSLLIIILKPGSVFHSGYLLSL